MIFSGHINKENAQKMGHSNAFDIKLVAGLVGEHEEEQFMVLSFTTGSQTSALALPISYIDNIKYDAFDLQEAEKVKDLIYEQKENVHE